MTQDEIGNWLNTGPRVFPARLGPEAPALARLVGAPAFKNPEPSQGQHSRLGPGLARPQAPALKKPG